MPKNIKGGKNHKKGKNMVVNTTTRKIILKEHGTEYAILETNLGNCRFKCYCYDDKDRLAHIRGNMRKRTWLKKGDLVLVSIRDFEEGKCDIIHKYNELEREKLLRMGEIKKKIIQEYGENSVSNRDQQCEDIEFMNDSSEKEDGSSDNDSSDKENESSDNDSLDIDNI